MRTVPSLHARVTLAFVLTSACAATLDGEQGRGTDAQTPMDGPAPMDVTPEDPTPMSDVAEPGIPAQVVVGGGHTCARLSDGAVSCWGYSEFGQVGSPGNLCGTTLHCVTSPTAVPGITEVTQVAVGSLHSCALRSDGTVWCWGANELGELNLPSLPHCGVSQYPCALSPTPMPGIAGVVQLSAGGSETCVRFGDGSVACWGAFPIARGTLTGVAEVSVGWNHACARMNDQTVQCWGVDQFGQLGGAPTGFCTVAGSSTPCSPAPQPVLEFSGSVQISAGVQVTCARHQDETVWCWGSNVGGELGREVPTCVISGTPFACSYFADEVPGVSNAVDLSVGTDDVCAVRSDGALLCWGSDENTQLGFSLGAMCPTSPNPCTSTPTEVPGLSSIAGVSAGFLTTCAWETTGRVACWGANLTGQIGDGTLIDRSSPTFIDL